MPSLQQKKDAKKDAKRLAQREAGGTLAANPIYAVLQKRGTKQNARALNAPPRGSLGRTLPDSALRPQPRPQWAVDVRVWRLLVFLGELGIPSKHRRQKAPHGRDLPQFVSSYGHLFQAPTTESAPGRDCCKQS